MRSGGGPFRVERKGMGVSLNGRPCKHLSRDWTLHNSLLVRVGSLALESMTASNPLVNRVSSHQNKQTFLPGREPQFPTQRQTKLPSSTPRRPRKAPPFLPRPSTRLDLHPSNPKPKNARSSQKTTRLSVGGWFSHAYLPHSDPFAASAPLQERRSCLTPCFLGTVLCTQARTSDTVPHL